MAQKETVTAVKCPSCEKTFITTVTDVAMVHCNACGFKGAFSQFTEVRMKKVSCLKCKSPLKTPENFIGRMTCPVCRQFSGNIYEFAEIKTPDVIERTNLPQRNRSAELVPPERDFQPAQQSSAVFHPASQEAAHVSLPASLVLTDSAPPCTPQTLLLRMGVNTIGRRSKTSDCAIQLDTADEFISRRHARIELRRNADGAYEYLLTDADSRNGTFLNEQRLYKDETVFLALGDRIRLGHTTFILS